MFEFNKLCKVVEEMDPQTYGAVIAQKSVAIIAALTAITKDGMDGMKIYTNFILCSIAADGKLDEAEYQILKPGFEALAGKEVPYEEAVAAFNAAGLNRPGEYKKVVDEMVDILGMISLDLKSDIVLVCMMICAVDGKISRKEKKWIKQLIR